MSTRQRYAAWRVFALFSVSVLLSACNRRAGANPESQEPAAIPVKVQIAQNVPVDDSSEYVATLRSRDSALVMPQVEGWITEIHVRSGETISAGQRLMQIDPAKQQATVTSQRSERAAKEAGLNYAREQYGRTSSLYNAGVVSKQELDQSKSALDAAEAELQALDAKLREQQVQLHYYSVNAPRAGIIGDVPVRVGDRVTSNTLLTTIDQPGSLEAYIYVPVERSGQLKQDMPAEMVNVEGEIVATSRVSFISPRVDDATQTVLVKSAIANRSFHLRTAQFVRVRLIWGSHRTPVVPVLAVSRLGGQYFAFVAIPAGKAFVARQRPLRIGQMVGNDYAVIEGIAPGDRIIVSGTQFLVDGMPVAPQS